jgi:hypothetical protein
LPTCCAFAHVSDSGGPVYPNETAAGCSEVLQCGTTGCLFDVVTDPREDSDLAFEPGFTPIREQMLQQLLEANRAIFNPDRGTEDPQACLQAVDRNGGVWGPFVFP